MKQHTTNYINTFIEVAEDCPAHNGEIPSAKGNKKTVAEMQYNMIVKNPYKFSSDDVFFQVFAERNDLTETQYEQERAIFFSKGQPCFRASPLTKRYGFGLHSDKDGKVALFAMDSEEYIKFVNDDTIKKVKAMRTNKK